VAAGAEVSLTTLRLANPVTDDERYWPSTLACRPSPPGAALDLLDHSIETGATVVGIGPFTNLALLEVARPGSLGRVPVVAMGGWMQPPSDGLPAWGPEMDWNVQWDTRAAEIVAATARLTLVTLPATLKAHLRAADLPRFRASGPLGELLARQSEARAQDAQDGPAGPHPRRPARRSAQLPLRPGRLRRRAGLASGSRRGDASPAGPGRRGVAL
jgi:hypothetical protein